MTTDPQRFARIVLAAFAAAGRTTDAQVGQAGGPSTSTMTKLRAAEKGSDLAQPRSQTWAAIERAANWPTGSAQAVWDGGEPPEPVGLPEGARQIGENGEDLVEFTVEGNFGVRAVVKGPVRDMDALQAAVSKLIAGMQVEESNTRALP
jgi:hypothetical protein